MRVLVLTISDRASAGEYDDLSGPAVEEVLQRLVDDVTVRRAIVPDDPEKIIKALNDGLDCDVILTAGGTGLGPRDVTPEVTEEFCDKIVSGIAEFLRAESLKETANAALSRATAGIKRRTLVINLPGSVRGSSFGATVLSPILDHAIKMMAGKGH